jgi:D-alanine-D-alanine ligase
MSPPSSEKELQMPDALQPRRHQPKIMVLYNENPGWPQSDINTADAMVATMAAGLREHHYTFELVKYFDDLSVLDRFDPREWLIWNWGEELAGRPWTEAAVAEALEQRGFAYTGAPPAVFTLTQNRLQVKECLRAAGLPTLEARAFSDPAQAAEWRQFPAIVKGLNQHSSYGIGPESVVDDAEALAGRIAYLRQHLNDDALVEPFLDTREFHVAVWGNRTPEALPPLELDYAAFDDMRDRLYTYAWKFDTASRGYNEIKNTCPAPLDRPDWRARLEAVAIAAYQATGLRDFGRVDLRMLGDEPQVLDVNANPDLDVTSVLPRGATALGFSFGQMVDRIIQYAAERMPAAV